MGKQNARESDLDKNKLIAAILTNALFTAKLVHIQKGTGLDSQGILTDVFSTWTAISQQFHKEATSKRRTTDQDSSDKSR